MLARRKVLTDLLDTLGVQLIGNVGRKKPRHFVTD